jgi:hypothetical protein
MTTSVIMGLIAHTCVEATVRYAAELGYEVKMVRDATADYSDEEMHAALDVNIPNYASDIVTTNEVVDAIASLWIQLAPLTLVGPGGAESVTAAPPRHPPRAGLTYQSPGSATRW